MKIEIHRTEAIDQWMIGIGLTYGADEAGEFHMIEIGFLLFTILILRYLK